MAKLTVKEESFCNKYIECKGDASKAFRATHICDTWKDETVWVKASQLLNSDKVQTRIKELQAELKAKSDITKDRVLDELDAILDAKITDYVNLTTKQIDLRSPEEKAAGSPPQYVQTQVLEFKDFSKLSERQIRAIESVRPTRNGIELKLHGKSWTIERICKMLGYDAPTQTELKVMNEFEHMTDIELDEYVKNAEGCIAESS